MTLLRPVFAVLALLAGNLAIAHDDATLAGVKAPNGGQLRAAGIHHYELVVASPGATGSALPVTVYVTDHAGTKIPTQGAIGMVTILSGGEKSIIGLVPAGDNVLKGSGSYVPKTDLKAIVSLTMPSQSPAQARFEPFSNSHRH